MTFPGFKPSPARSRSESGKSSSFRLVSGAGEPVKKVNINIVDNEKRKRREAEKVDNVLHLICWGPSSFQARKEIMSLRHVSRVLARAVEGLKEQSTRGVVKPSQTKPRSESDNKANNFGRRVSSGLVEPPAPATAKEEVYVYDKKRRTREAEKAENVMHLICWGPK